MTERTLERRLLLCFGHPATETASELPLTSAPPSVRSPHDRTARL